MSKYARNQFMWWKDSFEFAYVSGEPRFFLIVACAVTVSHGFLDWPSTDWYISVWIFWLFSCLDSTHRRLKSIETSIREMREMQARHASELHEMREK